MKKIILVLLLTVLVLSSCSSKKSIDEYVTTDNTEYVKSYRKLVDEELCTTYLDKVGFTIGIVTSYSEYEECFDIKIRQYEHFYWDFVQEKDKHFKKNGILYISYYTKYLVELEITTIEFKNNELLIYIDYLDSDIQSCIPEYSNDDKILIEVSIRKLKDVTTVNVVENE
jgi:hypothetical protein